MPSQINLADRAENFCTSTLNGPGERYVFWVQGCALRCTTDCLNPEYLAVIPKVVITVDDFVAYILELRNKRDFEGVTILGGEPFDQAESLAELGRQMQLAEISVMTYTGYTYEALTRRERSADLALLAITDILVDGPFIPALQSENLRWRGSSNQRLIFLSNRYSEQIIAAQPVQKGVNIVMHPDGRMQISGSQNKQCTEAIVKSFWNEGG